MKKSNTGEKFPQNPKSMDNAVKDFLARARMAPKHLRKETLTIMKENPEKLCPMLRRLFQNAPDDELLHKFGTAFCGQNLDSKTAQQYLAPFLRAILTRNDMQGRRFLHKYAKSEEVTSLMALSRVADIRDGVYAFGAYIMGSWWSGWIINFSSSDWLKQAKGFEYIGNYPLAIHCYVNAILMLEWDIEDIKMRRAKQVEFALETSMAELSYNLAIGKYRVGEYNSFSLNEYNHITLLCEFVIAPFLTNNRKFRTIHSLAMARRRAMYGESIGKGLVTLVNRIYAVVCERGDAVPEMKTFELVIKSGFDVAFENITELFNDDEDGNPSEPSIKGDPFEALRKLSELFPEEGSFAPEFGNCGPNVARPASRQEKSGASGENKKNG